MLELDNGTLLYEDIRQFGRLNYFKGTPDAVTDLGPDALEVSFEQFFSLLHARRTALKPLLLNQRFIGGSWEYLHGRNAVCSRHSSSRSSLAPLEETGANAL